MKPQESAAIVNNKYTLEDNLRSERFMREVSALQSKYVTPERMVRIALNAINRKPELRQCTQPSFFSALMRLSEVGLEPDGYHAHLIPFTNRKFDPPKKEVQLIIDYKGLVTVIRRNPAIAVVKGAVVYSKDKFIYREGSDRFFEHEPAWEENDTIKGAYSFVKLAQINDWELTFVPLWEINAIRKRSPSSEKGPWVTDFGQMCIKTALRRHAKMLPLTAEEVRATLIDDDTIEIEESGRRSLPQRTAEFRSKKTIEAPEESAPEQEDQEPMPEEREDRQDSVRVNVKAVDTDEQKEDAEFDKAIAKLGDVMTKEHVTDAELIFVLLEHSVDTGDAEQTGSIADLPLDTLKLASGKQWATLFFSINAKRKLEAAAATQR